jgi:hypothetical protein
MTSFCVWSRQLLADDPTKRAIYTDAHTSGMVPRWRDIAAMITTKTALIELPPPESLTALKRERARAQRAEQGESRESWCARVSGKRLLRERKSKRAEREGLRERDRIKAKRRAPRVRQRACATAISSSQPRSAALSAAPTVALYPWAVLVKSFRCP